MTWEEKQEEKFKVLKEQIKNLPQLYRALMILVLEQPIIDGCYSEKLIREALLTYGFKVNKQHHKNKLLYDASDLVAEWLNGCLFTYGNKKPSYTFNPPYPIE